MTISLDGSNLTTSGVINAGTAKTWNWNGSSSNSFIDFSIPIGATRITVMFNGVSTNGTSNYIVQISSGAGSLSTGYSSSCVYAGGTNEAVGATQTSAFLIANAVSTSSSVYGTMTLNTIGNNTWIATGMAAYNSSTPSAYTVTSTGIRTLSGTLDRVRITSVSSDIFDAGTFNVLYE